MSSSSAEVAVVGAGIGGLTLALALGARGIPVRVFEQGEGAAQGATGLQLSPNATRLLRLLAGDGEFARVGVRPEGLEILDGASGRRIVRVALGDACERRFGAPLRTTRRGALHQALWRAVAPGTVVPSSRVTSVQAGTDRVVLAFEDGGGHEAAVVVGADGIRSAVRAQLVGDPPVASGRAVYRGAIAPGDAHLPDAAIRIWTGAGRHCIAYPTTPDGAISLTAVVPAGAGEGGNPLRDLIAAYRGWSRELHDLFAAAPSLRRWELYDRAPLATWGSGRVTLLGDAAHPMLPFLAQGANAAIEDAVVLAGCLADGWPADAARALRRYESLRVPRASRLQAEARARADSAAAGGRRPERPAGSHFDTQSWIFDYDAQAAVTGSDSALVANG